MNLANQLTIARFFFTLAFVAALTLQFRFGHTVALVLFVIAGVTDYADGEVARRWKMESDFGRLMDPLVDKIMIAAAFICLVPMGAIPAWVATVIVSREFAITGLRLLAASKGQVLAAEGLGKHKTVWQIITVTFFLVLLTSGEILKVEPFAIGSPRWIHVLWNSGGNVLLTITVALTLASGLGYLWKNRNVIEVK